VAELVSAIEAARILGVRDSTIYRWIADGLLDAVAIEPVLLALDDLESFIEERRIRPQGADHRP